MPQVGPGRGGRLRGLRGRSKLILSLSSLMGASVCSQTGLGAGPASPQCLPMTRSGPCTSLGVRVGLVDFARPLVSSCRGMREPHKYIYFENRFLLIKWLPAAGHIATSRPRSGGPLTGPPGPVQAYFESQQPHGSLSVLPNWPWSRPSQPAMSANDTERSLYLSWGPGRAR